MLSLSRCALLPFAVIIAWLPFASAQESPPTQAPAGQPAPEPFRPPSPPGGLAAIMQERKLVEDFDADGDKRLNKEERSAAREFLKKNPRPRFGPPGGFPPPVGAGAAFPFPPGPPGGPGAPGGFGPPPGFGAERSQEPPKPGPRVSPADVKPSAAADLYAPTVLRTLFLDFETDDWEAELADFYNTDVEVPATLTVDGVKYAGVGVHFRGMSSFVMVQAGRKRSLNVSLDFTDKKQRLNGYKTLNLLNSSGDASFLSAVLYSHIARQFIPAPKANLVRVVINGESWGVYVNEQQFNKDFVQENFHASKGARWKVRGSPFAQGGLEYIGDDIAEYKKHYALKDGDDDDWRALISLCKTLNQTPSEQLEEALRPILDLNGVLWFLALDCALMNSDGYWVRASDYSLYRDPAGKFHLIPQDINEAFREAEGPGFGPGGPRFNRGHPPGALEPTPEKTAEPHPHGVALDPLFGMSDTKKPLRSRLLSAPSLRARYLTNVRTIAEQWLDWAKLGPIVTQYRALIESEIQADTRKVTTLAAFQKSTADAAPTEGEKDAKTSGKSLPGRLSLRAFADQRRAYLLNHNEIRMEN
jgi:hypothetical protein